MIGDRPKIRGINSCHNSTEVANLLTNQLEKFVTLNRHQLAGQVANLEFWIAEVRHSLSVLDGYKQRFECMKRAENDFVTRHQTVEFALSEPSLTVRPRAVRVPETEFKEARRSLCDATYRLLVRCYKDGLIDEARLRDVCNSLSIGVEAKDVNRS